MSEPTREDAERIYLMAIDHEGHHTLPGDTPYIERIDAAIRFIFARGKAAGAAEGWRKIDDDTAFAPPFGTIRACIDCGCLVAGGPTRCVRCATTPAPQPPAGTDDEPQPSPAENEIDPQLYDCSNRLGLFDPRCPCEKCAETRRYLHEKHLGSPQPSPAAAEGLSEATIATMLIDANDSWHKLPGHVRALAAEVERLRERLDLAEQVMSRDGVRAATVQVMRNERDQARAALREAHEIMRAIQRNNSGKFYDLEEHLAAHGEATK
jgi:hypothetical protein